MAATDCGPQISLADLTAIQGFWACVSLCATCFSDQSNKQHHGQADLSRLRSRLRNVASEEDRYVS